MLDLPEVITVTDSNGIKEECKTALCMLLKRLATPALLVDIEQEFGWERTRFSRITRHVARFLYLRWCHLLYFDPRRFTHERLEMYAYQIHKKGAPTTHVSGFIDGTFLKIARPVKNQRIIFNGWKRSHGLKFHTVLFLDGLHRHVFGPEDGRTHD